MPTRSPCHTGTMSASPNRILAAVVAVIVVVAVAVGIAIATQSTIKVEPGTPEATVKAYVTAVLDHDHDRAVTYLDPSSSCTVEDLDHSNYVEREASVELLRTDTTGDTARVVIRISQGTGGPFDDFAGEEVTFRLRRSGDSWKITGAPWPMFECSKEPTS